MNKNVDISMFMMVMINEILKHVVDVEKEQGLLYVYEDCADMVNAKMKDLGVENKGNTIDLKGILRDRYSQEYVNYLFDDVWVNNDCI